MATINTAARHMSTGTTIEAIGITVLVFCEHNFICIDVSFEDKVVGDKVGCVREDDVTAVYVVVEESDDDTALVVVVERSDEVVAVVVVVTKGPKKGRVCQFKILLPLVLQYLLVPSQSTVSTFF